MLNVSTFKRLIEKLPSKKEIRMAINSFSRRERILFVFVFGICLISAIILAGKVNSAFLETVPDRGGKLSEGLIGTPRFVNPVLALSDSDRDLTALIYSGLLRKSPTGGLIPDLAESYEISKDGLVYTFILRENIFFHDSERVTADDVVFTVARVKDSAIKSPKKLNWEGVTAEKTDERTVRFTLKQPYASFLENATLGILPAHLWREITPDQFSFIELNTEAVGSGPFRIKKIKKKSSGIPEYYELEPFKRFALGKPYLSKLMVRFYQNERELLAALEAGSIDQASAVSPERALLFKDKGYRVEQTTLPRIFALFFNHNQALIFANKKVIEAFDLAIDKDAIVRQVLSGYGSAISSPVPKKLFEAEYEGVESLARSTPEEPAEPTRPNREERLAEAKKILEDDGWKPDESGILERTAKNRQGKKETERLSFSLSTGDAPELKAAAELIKKDLEAIGASVEIKIYEIGSLNQDIIRPRKYEALLFGQIVGHEADLFAFWHSSQRNDPGLNIAMYTSSRADKALEAALSSLDKKERIKQYTEFEEEINKDMPAIFLYSPDFIYIVTKNLKGLIINKISNQSDRLAEVYEWYRETDKVWKIFKK